MNERDTKFQGFAKLLMRDLDIGPENDLTMKIISQRAYDLVEHVFNQMAVSYSPAGVRGMIPWLRDMDIWPEQERFINALSDLAKIEAKIHHPEKP